MSGTLYYGLDFQTWFLAGLLAYIFAILLVVYARYCFVKRTLCPYSKCGLHTTCETTGCTERFVCNLCKMEPCLGGCMCCRKTHSVNNSCWKGIPTLKCVCFPPNCSYCYCVCCEVSLDIEYEQRPLVKPVQII